jgi:acetylornithine deacetylase/succinyl-diaminopimelate desuccinylase-like protein
MRIFAGAVVLVSLSVTAAGQADTRAAVGQWVQANQRAVVQELVELLKIPNVAADVENIRRNAEHLRAMLAKRGFEAELLETEGNPLVYGELRVPGATRTLLLYCHYDGQPVAPERWSQPDPFVPVLRTGRVDQGGREIDLASVTRFEDDWRLYARSASDDKSPIVALVAALDALKASNLAPTSNIRVILDGEEEASSPSLVPAIRMYREKLRADVMIILDGPIHSTGRPTVALGARGIAAFDLTVFGPRSGVHSGNYGNFIPNPAQRLADLLASMKDDEGRILVAGFNDGIPPFTPEDRAILDSVPDDSARMLQVFGVAAPSPAFPKLQEAVQFPTLNVRGLVSAHVGDGRPPRRRDPGRRDAREGARAHPRAGLPPRGRRADRRRAREAHEAGAHGRPRDADQRLPHAAVRPAGANGHRRARAQLRRAADRHPHPRRYGADRPVHRGARLPGAARPDGQLRQQPARGRREPPARTLLSGYRDCRGGIADVIGGRGAAGCDGVRQGATGCEVPGAGCGEAIPASRSQHPSTPAPRTPPHPVAPRRTLTHPEHAAP